MRAVVVTENENTDLAVVQIDACTVETHSLTSTVTDHPVERGADISDHSRPDPELVTLQCLVSNSLPLNEPDPTRASSTYDALLDLRNNGTLVSVVTTLRVYDDMEITSISIQRTPQNVDALEWTMTLKHVVLVKNKLTTSVVATSTRAKPSIKKGGATMTFTAEEVDAEPQSLADSLSGHAAVN